MSNPFSSLQASLTISNSTFTPKPVLWDRRIGISFDALSIKASSSSVRPVVPITSGIFLSREYSTTELMLFLFEKSIIPSHSSFTLDI